MMNLALTITKMETPPATGQSLVLQTITVHATNGECSIGLTPEEVVYVPNDGFTGVDTCVLCLCRHVMRIWSVALQR